MARGLDCCSTKSYYDKIGIYDYLQVGSQPFSEPINFSDLSHAYLSNTFALIYVGIVWLGLFLGNNHTWT